MQLHGDEDPGLCDDLSTEVEVIKAFRVGTDGDVNIDKLIKPYDAVCDYYLFDTFGKKESLGGNAVSFDWEILKKAKIEKPFFISGGIGPDDVEKVRAFSHPDFFGIDISEGFEKSPGLKDMAEVLKFSRALSR